MSCLPQDLLVALMCKCIIAFDELRTDFKSPIDQCNPVHARERLRNIERICFLLRKLVLPEYSIHSLFCIMFLCAQEWLTLGLNVPLLFYHFWRYFHCPADSSELAYDPPVVMNADTLSYCQKEAWCKLAFYLLSFFYYLYCMIYTLVYRILSVQQQEGTDLGDSVQSLDELDMEMGSFDQNSVFQGPGDIMLFQFL
ncbi:putative protein cornichon-like isoform 1 [Cricetulus griseus]|nr:putative protein cornichon-like isoform 1 [Cricetulus griseus]